MDLYSIEWSYKEKKYLPFPNSAEHIIDKVLSQGSESEQLEKVKDLVSILTDKLLDTGLLKVEDIQHLLGNSYYKTKEEADKWNKVLYN
jgi:hypothetical protein